MKLQPIGSVVAGRRLTGRVTGIQKEIAGWLVVRPALLARLPGLNQDVEGDALVALDEAHQAMIDCGLISQHATSKDDKNLHSRWRVRRIVSKLRGEHVHG